MLFFRKRGLLSPFLLYMINLEETLKNFAQEFLEGDEHFLIGVERPSKNSSKYVVVIDGDTGVSIDFCSQLSRHISKKVDEELGEDIEAFTYEVSTPGVDRPLVLERQYPKHIGRTLKFTTNGETVKGELLEVNKGEITVNVEEKQKGKKKLEYKKQVFKLIEINEPKIIVSFK